MPTKITFLYAVPADPAAFDTRYDRGHLQLVHALPGVQRVEAAKVWPKEDHSAAPAYRSVDAYFPDYDSACASLTGPEAADLFGDAAQLAASGGLTVLFSDVDHQQLHTKGST